MPRSTGAIARSFKSGVLLDIEGTTTPISFVYDVLFPYARQRMSAYVRNADLTDLRREYESDIQSCNSPPLWSNDPMTYRPHCDAGTVPESVSASSPPAVSSLSS